MEQSGKGMVGTETAVEKPKEGTVKTEEGPAEGAAGLGYRSGGTEKRLAAAKALCDRLRGIAPTRFGPSGRFCLSVLL